MCITQEEIEANEKMLSNIQGLFEIHITVNEKDMYKFRLYCMDKKYKPIYAISEENVPQLMLSKYKNGSSSQEVIKKAKEIENDLKEKGIEVIRVKVESMGSNKGVPEKENNTCFTENYFEYHIKFPVATLDEYNKLYDVVKEYSTNSNLSSNPISMYYSTVFCSFNALKKEIYPIITMRVEGSYGSEIANLCKDDLMNFIKSHDIHTNEGIQFEFSVYDSRIYLDSLTTKQEEKAQIELILYKHKKQEKEKQEKEIKNKI